MTASSGFMVRVTSLVFVFKLPSLALKQVPACIREPKTNSYDKSIKFLRWLFFVFRSCRWFRSFQIVLGRFRSFLDCFRSFQIVLDCFRSFQMVLGRFSQFLTLVSTFLKNDKTFRNRNFNILIPYQPLKGVLSKTGSKNLKKGFEKYLQGSLVLN